MNKDDRQYRAELVLAEGKAQDDYDKAVLSLSGGGLGISFAFVDKFIGDGPPILPILLYIAWISWGISVSAVLYSYFFSQQAFRNAIQQFDDNKIRDTEQPGGSCATATLWFNRLGGALFIIGVLFMALFVYNNFGGYK